MIVFVISKFIDIGDENWPNIWTDLSTAGLLPPGSAYRDATDDAPSPPTSPNVMVEKLTITQAALNWILASPDYGEGAILYDEPNPFPPDQVPPAAEYGLRRAYAAKLGISQEQFEQMFGKQGNRKTRKEGADNLISWIRTLPKAKV